MNTSLRLVVAGFVLVGCSPEVRSFEGNGGDGGGSASSTAASTGASMSSAGGGGASSASSTASASASTGGADVCGDGVPTGAEGCDDGSMTPGDGCDAACQVEPGFTCVGTPSTCTTKCGDGIVAGTEQCDDMNQVSGDGCDAACKLEPFVTRFTDGSAAWPDDACNSTTSFGGCDTDAAEHGISFANYLCQKNGYAGGFWTGKKIPGCGAVGTNSFFCAGDSIPCNPTFENMCDPNDQTQVEVTCFMSSVTMWSQGNAMWPDDACNPTSSFGLCDSNAVDQANAWAEYACKQNGYLGGAWTGSKIGGCAGPVSYYCQGAQIPCSPVFENTCVATDQTQVQFLCY